MRIGTNEGRQRRWIVAGAALGLSLLGLSVPGVGSFGARAATTPAPDPTAWFTYTRAVKYSAVYSFVEIPMRDGAKLACDLQQPGTGTPGQLDPPGAAPAPGRFPGVIYNYTPYDAVNGSAATAANAFATLGYDVLNCDQRGLDRSAVTAPGQTWPQPYATIQTQDNYDMIEWLARQPFSNGRIGQTGGSAGAQTSTLVATLRPPHLKAIVALTAADNMYSDSRYKGGVFMAWGPAWAGIAAGLSAGFVNPALVTAQFKLHPLDDPYWQQMSPSSKFGALTIPDLQLEGWQDTDFPAGALRIFEGTKANIDKRAPQSSGPWVVQGPWGHEGSPACSPSPACGVTLAFLDHFVADLAGAPLPPARVQVFQEPAVGSATWKSYATWPPPRTSNLVLHLNADHRLAPAAGPRGTETYRALPSDVATAGTPLERADQSLTFTSPPLAHDVVVAGDPVLKVLASLTATDGIWAVQLSDVAPGGTVSAVNTVPWLLRATHRASNAYLSPVVPGAMTPYTVPGWALDYQFQKGHQIRVKLASAPDEVPVATSPSPNTIVDAAPPGDVTVVVGQGGSTLVLPVSR